MVYRYESDEDVFVEHPGHGSDLSVRSTDWPPPARPSPSRFPTPSLLRTTRMPLPATESQTARVAVASQGGPEPAPDPAPDPAPPPPPTPDSSGPRSVEPLPPLRGGGRLWQVLVGGAAVLVLLALCGLGGAALLTERGSDPRTTPTNQPAAADSAASGSSDLDSRDTDQAPLSAREVFPGNQLAVTAGQPAYQVLRSHSSGSCAVAATGEVADLLVRLGCNQVVRATLRTPDGVHLITAGLFNLTDRASAERARDRIRQMLDERVGRFRGMVADTGTEAIATAPARVGWQARGHYLAYALIARSDGQTIRSGDTAVREILYDMIELHLNQGVLERRAAGGVADQPTADVADDTGAQGGDDPRGR